MRRRESKPPKRTIIFLTCLLAVPTVSGIVDGVPEFKNIDVLLPYLMVGALLGVVQLILRPLLRLITASLGCLTLGMLGTAIDVGMVYACGYFVPGYSMPSLVCAIATAFVINLIAALFAGRK